MKCSKNTDRILIICSIHGEFETTPSSHLSGSGCLKCGNRRQGDLKFSNTKDFIVKAQKVHGTTYNYKNFDYKRASQKIEILCPNHGTFQQTPNKHLGGRGCPKCIRSVGEKKIISVLENFGISCIEQCRIKDCKNKNPLPFDVGVIVDNKLIGLIEY